MAPAPRILILAQTPPPTHGQSVMVGHLVTAALSEYPDRFVHVNLKLSKDEQDVGTMRPSKLIRLAICSLQAMSVCVLRRVTHIYYVPAPAKKGAVIRDVLLLSLLKPFTKRLILHWHSVGLGKHLQENPHTFWNRRLLHLLRGHHLSLCLSIDAAKDTEFLKPQHTAIVPNGIPDPCNDFPALLAQREKRLNDRKCALSSTSGGSRQPVQLLYLGLCTRSKGIFEALSTAVALAEALNHDAVTCPVTLTIAGPFRNDEESEEFHRAVAAVQTRLRDSSPSTVFNVVLSGFAHGAVKRQLLEDADLFLFPTRYENEGLPLTILEAMAFGLPVLSTEWRAIPEIFSAGYPLICPIENLHLLPQMAMEALHYDGFSKLRERFTANFMLCAHLETILSEILCHEVSRRKNC